jgi:hypothetical protein
MTNFLNHISNAKLFEERPQPILKMILPMIDQSILDVDINIPKQV